MFWLFLRSPAFVRRALRCAAACRLRGRGSRGTGGFRFRALAVCGFLWSRESRKGSERKGERDSIDFLSALSGCACVQVTISSAIPFFAGTFLSRNPLYDDDDEGTKKEEERIPKPSLSCSVSSAAPPWILRAVDCFLPSSSSQFFFCVWRWVPDVEVNSSCMRGADKLSRALHEDGVRGVEPEGRRGAAEAAGERRRRGRLPPGPPRAEGRRLGPGARRLPGQERRGPAVGSAIAGRRDGNARVGGGAQAQAEGGGTARCVETGVVWYTAPWIGNLVFVCKLEASTA